MTMQAHLATLEKRHGELEEQLHAALLSPSTKDQDIAELKRKKLKIKDEIARLTRQSRH